MNITIVGATGNVGRKTLEVLEKKKLQFDKIFLVASKKSAGKKINFNGEDHEACLGMARAYEGQGNRYYAGGKDSCGNEVDKDLSVAYRYFRKAESKIKEAMYIDIENKEDYKKLLKSIRYKKDAADES